MAVEIGLKESEKEVGKRQTKGIERSVEIEGQRQREIGTEIPSKRIKEREKREIEGGETKY